jgi:hypothetical protein
MSNQRVREIRQHPSELAFYQRYNAGDIVLHPGESFWDALSRRTEATRHLLTIHYTNEMTKAIAEGDWEAVRRNMESLLDVNPRNRRFPEDEYADMPPLEYAPTGAVCGESARRK